MVILCTCPDEKSAKVIASALVECRLAACVNIIDKVTSVYRWQERVVFDNEMQLVIKTIDENFDSISAKIKTLHPYEMPEIISLNIQQGDKQYMHWIMDSVK